MADRPFRTAPLLPPRLPQRARALRQQAEDSERIRSCSSSPRGGGIVPEGRPHRLMGHDWVIGRVTALKTAFMGLGLGVDQTGHFV